MSGASLGDGKSWVSGGWGAEDEKKGPGRKKGEGEEGKGEEGEVAKEEQLVCNL